MQEVSVRDFDVATWLVWEEECWLWKHSDMFVRPACTHAGKSAIEEDVIRMSASVELLENIYRHANVFAPKPHFSIARC